MSEQFKLIEREPGFFRIQIYASDARAGWSHGSRPEYNYGWIECSAETLDALSTFLRNPKPDKGKP